MPGSGRNRNQPKPSSALHCRSGRRIHTGEATEQQLGVDELASWRRPETDLESWRTRREGCSGQGPSGVGEARGYRGFHVAQSRSGNAGVGEEGGILSIITVITIKPSLIFTDFYCTPELL